MGDNGHNLYLISFPGDLMAENSPTNLNCPSCGAPLEFDGTSTIVRCKFCKNLALVPGLPAAKEATPRASLDEVRVLAQNGNLVEAIRRYREPPGGEGSYSTRFVG